jgi:hypothetical protein
LKWAKLFGQATETRPGKTVYRGDLSLKKSLVVNGEKSERWLRCVFEITENIMYLAARVVRHARRFKLSFGRHSPWFRVFRQVYFRLSG